MTKFSAIDPTTHVKGRSVNGNTKKYADEDARTAVNELDAEKQAVITDAAKIGGGLCTCQTAAATAAKTATLSNYLLLKNMPVSVFFENGIDAANATLNINSQGAKPIFVNGSAVQSGVIRPRTTATLVYDGTNYNVTCIGGLEQSGDDSDLWVDMGLPSGLKWAKKNIDVTQANGFAASEYQYECSFVSWGNTNMKNPSSSSAFTETWGSGNDTEPYVSSPGAALTGNIAPSMDAARVNLGAPWRMPTTGEYAELFANIEYLQADGTTTIPTSTTDKRVTVNGITGLYLKSKINGRKLFFPCSGYGNGASWHNRGSYGYYWASSLGSSTGGRYLYFDSGGVHPQYYSGRFLGFAVRAVQ